MTRWPDFNFIDVYSCTTFDLRSWILNFTEDSLGELEKRCNEAEEIANINMGARKQYSSTNFSWRTYWRYIINFDSNVHDFYTVVFGDAKS